MQLTVQGKQLDVGDALRTHVSEKLEELNGKFFNRAIEATVTFAREGHAFYKAHISIRIGKDIVVQSVATEDDPYLSFDVASGKVAKQMRKYKSRLRDHRERMEHVDAVTFQASDYVLAAEQDNARDADVFEDGDPVIVAEMATPIQTMSVSEAVMRMDLSGQPAMLFRNAKHNELNMVYRRSDGAIGWVDPSVQSKGIAKC